MQVDKYGPRAAETFIGLFPDRVLFALHEFFQTPARLGALGELHREDDPVHGGVLIKVVPRLSKVCKTVEVRSGHAGTFVQFSVGGEGIDGTTLSPHNLTEESLNWAVAEAVALVGKHIPIIYRTSDPKYSILNNQLVNHASGVAIPMDEPIFIFRAQDFDALEEIAHYRKKLPLGPHRDAVDRRVIDFAEFGRDHPDRLKKADTESVPE